MKEYVPTEEDLRDFEEFKAERECMERENKNLHMLLCTTFQKEMKC